MGGRIERRQGRHDERELTPAILAKLSKMRAAGRLYLEELKPETRLAVMNYDAEKRRSDDATTN